MNEKMCSIEIVVKFVVVIYILHRMCNELSAKSENGISYDLIVQLICSVHKIQSFRIDSNNVHPFFIFIMNNFIINSQNSDTPWSSMRLVTGGKMNKSKIKTNNSHKSTVELCRACDVVVQQGKKCWKPTVSSPSFFLFAQQLQRIFCEERDFHFSNWLKFFSVRFLTFPWRLLY